MSGHILHHTILQRHYWHPLRGDSTIKRRGHFDF